MSRLITDVGLLPHTIALTGSSILFFGVGVLELVGPMPIIRDKIAPISLKKGDKVRIFAAYFRRIAVIVTSCVGLVTGSSAFIASRTSNPTIARLSWTAAGASIMALPYTLILLKPINDLLLKLSGIAETRDLGEAEGKEVDQLIERWSSIHPPRIAMYGVAWVATLVGLVTALSGRV